MAVRKGIFSRKLAFEDEVPGPRNAGRTPGSLPQGTGSVGTPVPPGNRVKKPGGILQDNLHLQTRLHGRSCGPAESRSIPKNSL